MDSIVSYPISLPARLELGDSAAAALPMTVTPHDSYAATMSYAGNSSREASLPGTSQAQKYDASQLDFSHHELPMPPVCEGVPSLKMPETSPHTHTIGPSVSLPECGALFQQLVQSGGDGFQVKEESLWRQPSTSSAPYGQAQLGALSHRAASMDLPVQLQTGMSRATVETASKLSGPVPTVCQPFDSASDDLFGLSNSAASALGRTGSAPPGLSLSLDHPALVAEMPASLRSPGFAASLHLCQELLRGNVSTGLPRVPKTWWQILEQLHHLPTDTGLAIRAVISNALDTARDAEGVHENVLYLLELAINQFDRGSTCDLMRGMALKVLQRFKPQSSHGMALPLRARGSSDALRPGTATGAGMRQAQGCLGVKHNVRGGAQFDAKVDELKTRPWFDLIQEIHAMKPNNGYPIKVNIAAAIRSAQEHPHHKNAQVPILLTQALDGYARKSCGTTKQKALATLQLARTK
eukprot:jgi/Tetstr1/443934/TSEL_031886.t1